MLCLKVAEEKYKSFFSVSFFMLAHVLKDMNCFIEQNLLKSMTCGKQNIPATGKIIQKHNGRKGIYQTTYLCQAHLLCKVLVWIISTFVFEFL